jgi:DNA-binding NarL/FixJ family response regulator
MTVSPNAEEDSIVQALDGVYEAVVEATNEGEQIQREISRIRQHRVEGLTASEAIGDSQPPRILSHFDRLVAASLRASSTMRALLVRQLVEEGHRVTSIAKRLGVSHQRVSELLHRSGG